MSLLSIRIESLQLLLLGPEYHHTILKIEKAVAQLVWAGSKTITPEEIHGYRETVAAEQDVYLVFIGKVMESF